MCMDIMAGQQPKGRVVGGMDTGPNEYPLIASIQIAKHQRPICGGTILTPYHIITAAHCTLFWNENELVARVGAHDLRKLNSTVFKLKKIHRHDDWDPRTLRNDIAILETRVPIHFTQNVGPACLPSSKTNLDGELVKALGWGRVSPEGEWGQKDGSPILQEVDVHVINITECAKKWKTLGAPLKPNVDENLCTHDENKDVCQGDSGGPMIWLDPETNSYTLVAVISFGDKCATDTPGVNTDVGAYLNWIKNTISSSNRGVTACSGL